MKKNEISRRELLKGSAVIVAAAVTAPSLLTALLLKTAKKHRLSVHETLQE